MGNTAASWKNATKKLSDGYEKLTDTILKHKKIAIPLLYVILIAIPFLGPSQYFIRVLCLIGVYSILTLSLNLIAGYMGQTSMGHAALYCLGGYFSALLGSNLGLPFWVTVFFGILGGALGGRLHQPPGMARKSGALDGILLRRNAGPCQRRLQRRDQRAAAILFSCGRI